MASSKVDIFNTALVLIGEASIVSEDENNARARVLRSLYPIAHKYILSLMDWPFARKFVKLRQLSDVTTPSGWYAYGLPSDFVTPVDLEPIGSKTKWSIMGDQLWTVLSEEVYLYYTRNETNPQKFSPTFDSVLADYLAARACGPITGDKVKSKELLNDFHVNSRIAQAIDANIGSEYRHEHNDPDNDSFNM